MSFANYKGDKYQSRTDANISTFSALTTREDLWSLTGKRFYKPGLTKAALWYLVEHNRMLRKSV